MICSLNSGSYLIIFDIVTSPCSLIIANYHLVLQLNYSRSLCCPGAKFIFPFSELDGVDMEKLRRAMIEIIKCSNRWNSPFTDTNLNFDKLGAEKYADKILKQLRSEIKNVYFYN